MNYIKKSFFNIRKYVCISRRKQIILRYTLSIWDILNNLNLHSNVKGILSFHANTFFVY